MAVFQHMLGYLQENMKNVGMCWQIYCQVLKKAKQYKSEKILPYNKTHGSVNRASVG
jgi:hypothetical protein